MNSFDNIEISKFRLENLNYCVNENYASGLRTKAYFAPASYFSKINIPNRNVKYDDYVKLDKDDLAFLIGGWAEIDILIEENELRQTLIGPLKRKKIKTELDLFILGFKTNILGFIEKYKNTPIIMIVVDAVGNNWLIGNLRNYALIESGDISTQRKYEENSGAKIKIVSNSTVLFYGNDKNWITQDLYTGDFNYEFTTEYD